MEEILQYRHIENAVISLKVNTRMNLKEQNASCTLCEHKQLLTP